MRSGICRQANRLALTFFFLTITQLCFATVIHVPGDQPTIQAGIDAALDGDTVLVAAGHWYESILIMKPILLQSQAGSEATRIESPGGPTINVFRTLINNALLTCIQGFTIANHHYETAGIVTEYSVVEVKECIFEVGYMSVHTSMGYNRIERCRFEFSGSYHFHNQCVSCHGGHVEIVGNVFDNLDKEPTIYVTGGAEAYITNNTIVSCWGGISCKSHLYSVIYNNILYECDNYGVHTRYPSVVVDYNMYFANGQPTMGLAMPGPHAVLADPGLLDPEKHDFDLREDSPAIDAGHPGDEYRDPDSTRNDIGASYFPSVLPVAVGMNLGDEYTLRVINHQPTIYWTFDDNAGSQVAFELEVGSDDDWTVAENWQPGPLSSSDTSITYLGTELIDGLTYYFRVQVSNGVNWGSWRYGSFRMNDEPSVPVPLFPINNSPINVNVVKFIVENSSQMDSDSVSYDFELYLHHNDVVPEATDSAVDEQIDLTSSRYFAEAKPKLTYWWRTRANDGFETSAWSSLIPFITQSRGIIRIPSDQSTLMAGLHAADNGDTVLVMPGIYSGEWNRDLDFGGKAIVMRSETGPEHTIIDCEGNQDFPHRGLIIRDVGDSIVTIDGLTIKNAFAPGFEDGGGIFCSQSGLKLVNCVLENNVAYRGAGLCIFGQTAEIRNTTFAANNAWREGSYGGAGALLCRASDLIMEDCSFSNNNGGGMFSDECSPEIINCIFQNNVTALSGAALYVDGRWVHRPQLSNCQFISNSANDYGGAVYIAHVHPVISECTFSGNHGRSGGALCLDYARAILANCTFDNNDAGWSGGAVFCDDYSPSRLSECVFKENTSAVKGGAIYCNRTPLKLMGCEFSGNSATEKGGGVWGYVAADSIMDCIFYNNEAQEGGGIYFLQGIMPVVNCTFSLNHSLLGGACYLHGDASPQFDNCIFAFNSGGEVIYSASTEVNPVFACCDIYGNESGDWIDPFTGYHLINGNISADPLFCDTSNGDLTIDVVSPCTPGNNECGVLIGALNVGCGCHCPGQGDCNDDGLISPADVVYLINYALRGGSPPPTDPDCPAINRGDFNCDNRINLVDVVAMINYVFRQPAPGPCNPCAP